MTTYGPTAIAQSSDDAAEDTSNNVNITAASYNFKNSSKLWIGYRWSTGIPQGATINSSKITLTEATGTAGGDSVEVYGHKVASSATFTTTASSLSSRARTTAHVTFNMPTAAGAIDSPSLNSVIQELANQGSWDGSVTLLLDTTNCASNHTFDNQDNGSGIATLTITYTAPAPPIGRLVMNSFAAIQASLR